MVPGYEGSIAKRRTPCFRGRLQIEKLPGIFQVLKPGRSYQSQIWASHTGKSGDLTKKKSATDKVIIRATQHVFAHDYGDVTIFRTELVEQVAQVT